MTYSKTLVRLSSLLLPLLASFLCDSARAQTTIGGSATISVQAATVITLNTVPPSATVVTSGTQVFAVSIANDALSAGATVTLSGPSCSGATCGTISPAFLRNGQTFTYTAPSSVPTNPSVVVTVTSVQDVSRFTTSNITVTGTVSPTVVRNISTPPINTIAASSVFPITSSVGNLIAVGIVTGNGVTITGVTDNKGNTYTDVGCQQDNNGGHAAMFFANSATTGVTSITVADPSPVSGMGIIAWDISNSSSTPLIGTGTCGGSNTPTTTPVGPSGNGVAGGIVLSAIATNTTSSVSSPFTFDRFGIPSNGMAGAHALVASNGTFTPTWSITSNPWAGITASFANGSQPPVIRVNVNPATAQVQTNANQNFTPTVINDSGGSQVTLGLSGAGCSGGTCGTLSATGSRSATINSISNLSGLSASTSMLFTGSGSLTAGTVGNFLAMTLNTSSNLMVITGATDDKGNAWTVSTAATDSGGGTSNYIIWTTTAAAAGVKNITVTATSPAGAVGAYLYDASLTPSTFSVAQQHLNNQTATTNPIGPSITPTGSGLTISVISPATGNPTAVAAPFTVTQTNSFSSYYLNPTTAAIAPSWTTGSGTWAGNIISVVEAAGSINSGTTVTYTAPAAVPSPPTVTLTATSVSDNTKTGTATITITGSPILSVVVSPTNPSITAGSGTISFTPTVSNDPSNLGVTWSFSNCNGAACGTLSSNSSPSGSAVTYTPPATVSTTQSITLTATSVTNGSISASATILVNPAAGGGGGTGGQHFDGRAFPEAQGGGAETPGGRGGTIMEITTTNDGGSGSFRACATASGPRTCVFRVAGLFPINSELQINNPFLTIAGQTAPGEVILGGPNTPLDVIRVSTHDVIIRYVTISPDNRNVLSGPQGGTSGIVIINCAAVNNVIGTGGCFGVIVDHVTTRWAGNKTFAVFSNFTPGAPDCPSACNGPNHKITFQWSMLYEPHVGHPVGIGNGTDESGTASVSQLEFETDQDWHHNLFANLDHRIPEGPMIRNRWVNNITYNWNWFAVASLGTDHFDVINNLWKAGNMNSSGPAQAWPILISDCRAQSAIQCSVQPSVYLSGNIGAGSSTVASDQYTLANEVDSENGNGVGAVPSAWRRTSPISQQLAFPITADPATNLESVLLPTVGNSRHLDCNGEWVNHRDQSDARIVTQYQNNSFGAFWPNGMYPPINNQSSPSQIQVPTSQWTDQPVTNFPACVSTLHDGIPDAWRTRYNISASANSIDPVTGWTQIENFMDHIVP